mgnify:CR=1 FL=1
MNKSRSQRSVELTPELEAEIRARTKIRPDEPGTNPGDPGNGHVLVIDEQNQRFDGINFHKDGDYFCRYARKNSKTKTRFLHHAVWEFHNGAKPEDYVLHHDHKDANGHWDTTCNDIENILLMTPAEHKSWHSKYNPLFELECARCHKIFLAKAKVTKYCLDCARQVKIDRNKAVWNKKRQSFKTFEESSKDVVVENKLEELPRISGWGETTIRYCVFCKRPFEAPINTNVTMCGRPDCAGQRLIRAHEQAIAFIHKEREKRFNGLLKFTFRRMKQNIRCLFIDGEIWFIARDVAEALGYKNPLEAIREHVKPKHKGVREMLTPGGKQKLIIIDEAGFYRLCFTSKLPEAEAFTEWVTSVVLPTLRKYGRFVISDETVPPIPLPEGTTLELVDTNDQPFSFSTDEREFMQKFIPAYRQMSEDDRALLSELIERNQN